MAGDWIKMRTDLRDDPAVISIAAATGLDEDTVVGKLHRLWSWANRQTIDGNAVGVNENWIDRYLCVTGIAKELEKVGWLSAFDGGVEIPKFDRHNGESAKRRALTARRVAKFKVTHNALPREEKRREEKIVSTNVDTCDHPSDGSPAALYSFPLLGGTLWSLPQRKADEYEATYGDRLDVRAELRKARQWLMDHKPRRPKSGMAAFLTRWLNRAYDSAPKTLPGSRVAAEPDGAGKMVFNPETGEIVRAME